MNTENRAAIGQVFNTAAGERATLLQLVEILQHLLAKIDLKIADVQINFGCKRDGDIPHSLVSISKTTIILDYMPTHQLEIGLDILVKQFHK